MTSPDNAVPEKTLTPGDLHEMQDYTEEGIAAAANTDLLGFAETARLNFLGTILGGFLNVAANITNAINQFISDLVYAIKGATGGFIDLTGFLTEVETTANTAAVQVADLSEIAVTSVTTPIWWSTGGSDIATFPRMMMQRVPSGTSSATVSISDTTSGGGSHSCSDAAHSHSNHTHSVSATDSHNHGISWGYPTYKPGKRVLDLFFIRCDRKIDLSHFKVIMGGDGLFGIDDMFLVLYGVNPTTDVLSKLWDSGDISGSVGGDSRQEVNVSMGTTFAAEPGHLFAVGQLQIAPGALQETRTIAGLATTNIAQAAGTWPASPGAYLVNQSTAPSTITMGALTFVDDKVGWFALAP